MLSLAGLDNADLLLGEEAEDLAAVLRAVGQTAALVAPVAAAGAAVACITDIARAHAAQQPLAEAWARQREAAREQLAASASASAPSSPLGDWLAAVNPCLAGPGYAYGARLSAAGMANLERLLDAEPEELAAALDAELGAEHGRPQVLPAHRRRIMREHEAQRAAEVLEF
jgi:hypothetical protein